MVAVIAGNGLGLGNTSLTQLGLGLGGQAGIGQANVDQYLNAANGNLILQSADEGLIFDGLPLNVLRTYNSQGQLTGNNGWLFGFSRNVGGLTGTLDTAGSTITRTDDDGSAVVYAYNTSTGAYDSMGQSGAQDTLTRNTGTSSWTWADSAGGQQETYDSSGKLTAVSDAETGAQYAFSYSGGQLSTVTAGDGDTLLFGYNASNQLISLSIQEVPPGGSAAVTRQQVGYAYDAQGRLSSVTTTLASDTASSSASYSTTYTYSGSSERIASVSQSDGTTVSYTYGQNAAGQYQVTGITTGSGAAAQALTLSYGSGTTTVTDGLYRAWTYQYNASGQLSAVIAPAVNGDSPTTQYTYDSQGNLLQMIDANNATTSYSYDANGNLLSVEDGDGNTISYTYDASSQVLSKTTYTEAAQGRFGQSDYVAPSGAQTTYYVYGVNEQLAYVIDPLGHVTENTYSTTAAGLSELTTTRNYLGASFDLSHSSPAAPPTLSGLQAWAASAAVQSTLGQTSRIDYAYDMRGQLSTKTQWDEVDTDGKGVLDAGTLITTTSYDASGRLLHTATETGSDHATLQVSTYAYDGLGRIVSSTDPSGNVTSYVYLDNSNTLAITQANGTVTTQVRNSAGQLVSSTQTTAARSSSTTSYLYDADGRQAATIDPQGNVDYTFYDADGRISGTISATGAVTQYAYDARGNVIETTHYANTVNTEGWVSDGELSGAPSALILPSSSAGLTSRTLYDASGDVVASIDPSGYVTTTSYDGTGQPVSSTRYATPLTTGQLAELGDEPSLAAVQAQLTASGDDRTTLTIYDADGRAVGRVDPAGTLQVTRYDAVGNVIAVSTYAQALTPAQRTALGMPPTLPALSSLAGTETRTIYNAANEAIVSIDAQGNATFRFYNAAGELAGTVDPGGAVTAYAYDANGRVTQTTHYATAVATAGWLDGSMMPTSTLPSGVPVPAASADDRVSTQIYDAAGERVATIDPSGNVTVTGYDGLGNATTTTQYATPLSASQLSALGSSPTLAALQNDLASSADDRATRTIYDADNRPVAVIDAAGFVTTTAYDADGHAVLQTAYATALTGSQLNALEYAPSLAGVQADLTPSAQDQATRAYYDGTGQIVAQVDADGYLTVSSYDAGTQTITAVRYVTALTPAQVAALDGTESVAALIGLLDSNTATEQTSTTYNAEGQVASHVAADGTLTTYQYNGRGQLLGTTTTPASGQGAARMVGATYDAYGNTLTTTDANGATTTYAYNANHQRIEATDPSGNSLWYFYDASGRLAYTVQGQPGGGALNATGNVTAYSYDAFGDVTSTKAYAASLALTAAGSSSTTVLNPATAAASDIAAALNALQAPDTDADTTISTTYTSSGQVATVTDGDGYATAYGYDAFGDLVQTQQQLSQAGAALSASDSTTTQYTYDARGRQLSESDAVGSAFSRTTASAYDAFGRLIGSTDGNGNTVSYSYDDLGNRLTTSLLVQGQVRGTQTTYDAFGHVLTQTDAAGHVTNYQYDLVNHTITTTSPDGVVTTTVEDAFGNTLSTTDGAGSRFTYTYDADGRLRTTTDALGNVSSNDYDADGRLSRSTSAAGVVVDYTYDASGRLSSKAVYPDGPASAQTTLYTYDGEGRQLTVTDPLGSVTQYVYDADGNVLSQVQDAGDGSHLNQTTTYAYDGAGNVLSRTEGAGSAEASTTQYVYDNLGRLTQQIVDPSGLQLTTTYAYDANGNRVSTTDPDGEASYTIYNEANEAVFTIKAAGAPGAGQGVITQNWYDANGRQVSTRVYSTVIAIDGLDAIATDSVSDNLAQAASLSNRADTAADPVAYAIYNADGQLIYRIDPMGNVSETRYNALGQVSETLGYARPVAISSELNDALQAGTALASDMQRAFYEGVNDIPTRITSFNYDANGRLTYTVTLGLGVNAAGLQSLPVPGGAGLTNLTLYDASGDVVASIDASGYVTTTSYDGTGQPVSSTRYATPLTTGQLAGLGDEPTLAAVQAQLTASGDDRTTLTIYDADGRAVGRVDPAGTLQVTRYDAVGNVIAVSTYAQALTPAQRTALGMPPTLPALSSLAGTETRTIYNAANEAIVSIDAQGNATFRFYNAAGELAGTVDPGGAVTAYAYDANGRVTQTTHYATAVATAGWLDGSMMPTSTLPSGVPVPAASADDRVSTQIYDAAGERVATIDPSGNVTVTGYDGLGNATTTTQYATPLSASQLSALGSSPTLAALQNDLASSADDRATRTIYDADNRPVAVIDAAGFVTTTAYDADGHAVLQTAYATALTGSQLNALEYAPSLAGVQADLTPSAQDQATRAYYDGTGQIVAQVDADGYLTVSSYDAGTQTITAVRYVTALTPAQVAALDGTESVAALIGLLDSNTATEQTSTTYNAEGQVASHVAADGTLTTYQYNGRGQLLGTTTTPASGQGAARMVGATYDAYGNTLTTTDANGATTTYAYNANHQRIEATDPSGNSLWYFYDASGRLAYTVQGQPGGGAPNATGDVVANAYDAFGDVISTSAYTTALTLVAEGGSAGTVLNPGTASLSDIANALSALSASDADANTVVTFTYTNNGQVASLTDGDGYQTTNTYDAFGDLIQAQQQLSDVGASSSASNSTVTDYTYDARGEQSSESDAVGSASSRTTASAYDAFGRVIGRTDGNGNTVSYSYDDLGNRLTTSLLVQGQVRGTQTTYDAFGHVLTQTDAAGHVTNYQYDLANHTITTTSPDGVVTTTVEDAFGNTLSTTDGAGNRFTYTYDADGRLRTTTDALGNVSSNDYDADGRLSRSTSAAGVVVDYAYDADGRVLSKTIHPAGPNAGQATVYTYDGEGRELTVTDALGTVTAYAYDADGNVLNQVQDAGDGSHLNQTTTYTYDGAGNVLSRTEGAGSAEASTTQYVYDNLGRLTQQIVDPGGLQLTTTYAYDANGNRVSTTDPDGEASYTIYNEANEAVFTIKAAGAPGAGQGVITQNWYDANGRQVSTRVYSTVIAIDGLDAIATDSVSDNLAQAASLSNRADTAADPVAYAIYNADGQLIYQIDPVGNVSETRYNALGQVSETLGYARPIAISSELNDALQAGTALASDIQYALASASDSDSTARVAYTYYDADGRVAYTVTPDLVDGAMAGVVRQTQYDSDGRIAASTVYAVPLPLSDLGDGSSTASIAAAVAGANTAASTSRTQYLYDLAGRQVAQVDPDGHASYTFYDAAGRVSLTVDPTGAVVKYTRDALDRVIKQTSYAAAMDTSGWLVDGVVTITQAPALPAEDPYSNNPDRVIQTTYDALGRISSVSRYSAGYEDYSYYYNPASNQYVLTDTSIYTGTNGDRLTYTYDASSRVVQSTDVDLSGNQPSRVTSYFYDADGNTTGVVNADGYLTTHSYDAAGQLTQTVSYTDAISPYGNAGVTLSQLIPASSDQRTTTDYYDAQGNLSGSLDADGYFTQYDYDLNGNQISATRYATAIDPGSAQSLEDIESSLNDGTSLQTLNTYDSYGDLVSTQNYQGTLTQYVYDNLGRVVQTTVAAGTEDARTTGADYDAFGNVIDTTDALGDVTGYTYDLAGNKTSATDALGNTTWYVYDQDNRLNYTVRGIADANGNQNALGEVSRTDYDTFGDVQDTYTSAGLLALGEAFTPTLAALNQATFEPSADSDGDISYSYDLEGNVVNKYDGNGNRTYYTYDGFNELTSKVDPAYNGLTSNYTYDALGQMTSEVDESGSYYGSRGGYSGSSPSYSGSGGYNGSGGGLELRELQWTYDAYGNVATYTDGDGATTSYSYDNLDQKLTQSLTVAGAARASATSYDAYGRVLSSTDPMGLSTTYSYDDAARSMTVTTPGGVSTTTAYNEEGQAISVTDANGDTTAYQYDADGHLVGTTNTDGSTVAQQYDAVGNLIQSRDADGHVTAYTYDAAGRVLTQTVDPAGAALVTTYAYDGRGLEVSVTDPTGAVTTYLRDGNGNVQQMVQDAGSAANDLNITTYYNYNELNEVTSRSVTEYVNGVSENIVNNNANDEYQYDSLGRLISETQSTGLASFTRFAYDADGNVTAKTDGNGNTSYYVYDEAGEQIYSITPAGGNGAPSYAENYLAPSGVVTQFSYNADGQKTASSQYATELSPDDMQSIAYQMQMIQNDLGYGRVVDPTIASSVASMIAPTAADRVTYQLYNADGQIQYSIDPTGAVTETRYNNLGQVSQTLAYTTPIGISASLSAAILAGTATSSDIQNALSSANDSSANARGTYRFYDDMGRVRYSISSEFGGAVLEYGYDSDGNLTSTTQYAVPVPPAQLAANATTASIDSFLAAAAVSAATTRTSHDVYDDAGRLVYAVDALGAVTQTQYDGDDRVTWTLQYANPISAPSSWAEADVAAAVQAANPDTSSVHGTGNVYDGVGNVIQTLDTRSATPTATFTYDERGLKLSATDRDGNTWQYQYDAYGNLTEKTSPPVAVALYDSNGNLGTGQESLTTIYQYNSNGNLTSKTEAANTPQARTTQYVYDAAGNVIQTIQADPEAIDPATGLLVPTGAAPTVNTTYDAFGDAVVSQDANGNYVYSAYDADGRLTYSIDGDGYATGYQYNAYGQQTAVTRYAEQIDTSALVASGTWSAGQPLSLLQLSSALVTSAADRTLTTAYDSQGNKLSVTEPAVSYTKADGTTSVGSPVTQYSYDAFGNMTSEAVLLQGDPAQSDAVWATTYNYYDALGRQVMTVDPMGYVTTHTYDAFGDVLNTTQWATAISTSGLVAGGPPPAHPPAGTAATTGLDRITNDTYDNDGNKTSQSVLRTYVDASGATVEGYVTTTFGYDGENRAIRVTENGQTVTTQYDALGQVTRIAGPQQPVLVSNWQALLAADPSLDLTSASLYALGSQVVSYTYDALGNRLTQSTGSTTSSQSVTTYDQYDQAGRLVASVTPLDGGAPNWTSDQVETMTYDGNGNVLTSVSTLTGNDASTVVVTTRNTYDADNQQLTSVTTRPGVFVPDKSVATQYNAFGEVVASGDGVTVNSATTYDNAGNRLTAIDPKTGELHAYGYNLAGQQVIDTMPLAAAVGGTTATIATLDRDGRIVAEQAPGTNAASGENTGTLQASYDRWGNVLSTTDAAGHNTTYTYNDRNQVVTQTGATVTVVGANGVGTSSTPTKTSAYDAEGNLVSVTDENGNVTLTAVDALGQTIQTTDGTGAVSYVAYDALGNEVADQSGTGHITFKNVDALGRVVQQGDFVLSSDGLSRAATWQQAYVLDQAGNRIVSYDGIGSADLQSGDSTDAALHANYDGYDSQGRVIWSQDAAQRAASVADAHGTPAGSWTQAPTNADFSQVNAGWDVDPSAGWAIGGGQAVYTGAATSGSITNQDRVPVIPGQTISATSPPILIPGDHGGGVISIYWYDANGNPIAVTSGNIVAKDDSGKRSYVTGTAPAGAAFASLNLGATDYGRYTIIYSGPVTWDYVPPAGATSTGANGSLIVWQANGSYTQQPANPDFEDGNTGWDLTPGWSIDQQSNTSNGTWVAAYNGVGPRTMANQDRVPVTAGQTISASVQVSLYLAPDGASAAAQVLILWYDASGNLISASEGNVVSTDRRGAYHTSAVTGTAPAGAAYAAIGVSANSNGIGAAVVDAAVWNYQYIPAAPTGVVQDTYVYDMDGHLVGQTTADRDSETWQYNAYGQVTHHTDLSGANYSYTYDARTGALTGESDNWSPTAQGQATPAYVTAPITTPNSSTDTYYADGQLATQTYADGSVYRYSYDANGNAIRVEAITVDGNDQAVHTVTQSTYDSHNRLSNVQEINEITGTTLLDETITYDAAGNRREVSATSGATTVNAWYTYDGDNRVAVSAGSLVNGQIVVTDTAYAYAQTYDGDGNVTSQLTVNGAGDTLVQRSTYNARDQLVRADYAVDLTTGGASRGVEETRTYDADGHVLIDDQYYALGTMLGALPAHRVNPDDPDSGDSGDTGSTGTDVGGELDSATINYYDSVGRLAVAQTFGHASGWDGSDGGAAPTSAPGVDATTFGALSLQSEVVYQGAGGSAGYDADGDVVAYQYRDGSGRIDQYAVTYLRKDSYLQSTTSGENVSNTPNVRPSTDESVYDDRGNLVALTQHTQYAGGTVADTVRVFAYDGNGEIIERRDGTANGATLDQGTSSAHENQHYVYVNGQQVAHVDEGGTVDVLSEVTAFSSSTNGPNDYVVQGGDTLQSIAQAAYGDASLWYVIAQANALSSDSDLSIGQRLTIPQVTTNSNTATTVKPYDPSQVIGSTTPNLPIIAPPPPPPSHHCNALADIVVIAVTIAVTIATQGATSDLLYEELATTAAEASAETVAAVTVASAAVAAGAGNLAGQLTGDVEGIHQGVDFGSIGESALSAAVTAGVTDGLGQSGTFLADSTTSNGLSAAGDAVQAAASYVGNVAASKLTGEPTHFSWAGLVANSVAGAVSGQFGSTAADTSTGQLSGNYFGNIAAIATGDIVGREVGLALGDNHVQSWAQIGESIGGNALANGAIAGINAYQAYQKQQQSSQLPAIDAPMVPINVPAPVLSGLAIGDIPQAINPVGFQNNETNIQTLGASAAPSVSADGATAASNGSEVSPSTPSSFYFEGGQPRLYFVDPASSDGGTTAPDGFTRVASDASLIQMQDDINQRTAQGIDTTKSQQALDELATRTYQPDGTSGDGAYAPPQSGPVNTAVGGVTPVGVPGYNAYLQLNADGTPFLMNGLNVTNNVPVSVKAPSSDGTTSVPYTALSIDPPSLALDLPAPSAPAYAPDIQPIDLGPIPLSVAPSNLTLELPSEVIPPITVPPVKLDAINIANTSGKESKDDPFKTASEATNKINLGSEELQTFVNGIGKAQGLKVLNRAASLQSERITKILENSELDKAVEVVSESSKSGLAMAKYLPLAKGLGRVAVGAQIANIGIEVAGAPTDQKAKVLAEGASSAVVEAAAVESSFELGAVLGSPFIPPFGSLIGGAIAAGITAFAYGRLVEEPVKVFIGDTIKDTNQAIDEHNRSVPEKQQEPSKSSDVKKSPDPQLYPWMYE